MNWQIWFIIILFVFIAALMASQKFSLATVSLCCAVALEASGILTFKEAWGGLLQSSVVMMASMFVVGHALTKTSLLKRATRSLIKPGASDSAIAFGLFIMTFIITCFVNGITTVSIMAPIVVTVCKENKRPVSKFMQGVAVMSMVWAGVIPTGGNAGGVYGCQCLHRRDGRNWHNGLSDIHVSQAPHCFDDGSICHFSHAPFCP